MARPLKAAKHSGRLSRSAMKIASMRIRHSLVRARDVIVIDLRPAMLHGR